MCGTSEGGAHAREAREDGAHVCGTSGVGFMNERYARAGPGAITPGGCAVERPARLPAVGEPRVIASGVPPGCRRGRLRGVGQRGARDRGGRGIGIITEQFRPATDEFADADGSYL